MEDLVKLVFLHIEKNRASCCARSLWSNRSDWWYAFPFDLESSIRPGYEVARHMWSMADHPQAQPQKESETPKSLISEHQSIRWPKESGSRVINNRENPEKKTKRIAQNSNMPYHRHPLRLLDHLLQQNRSMIQRIWKELVRGSRHSITQSPFKLSGNIREKNQR